MNLVFTGVCDKVLVQALYNELQPEQVTCIGRLIQTHNPLADISDYYYEIKGAKEAAKNFENNSIDIVWIGNTDDNEQSFERAAWLPKLKNGGRIISQNIYKAAEPIEIFTSTTNFPDNWYLIKA